MNDSRNRAAARKDERICLRVSHLDKVALKKKASAVYLSLSDYLIAAGLARHISFMPSKIDEAFVRQLSRIGNNLNQLAYRANCGDSIPKDALQSIFHEIKQLREVVK